MFTLEQLQGFLPINKDKLDEELERNSQLFWEASDQYAEAANKRDQAKQVLAQLDANIGAQFRQTSVDRVSEAKVTEFIEANLEHVQQYRMYLNYKFEAERWGGMKDAFEQRLHALRGLVSLTTMGYYGSGVDQKMIESYTTKYQNRINKYRNPTEIKGE